MMVEGKGAGGTNVPGAAARSRIRELLARHIHRMVKYREAESTEVIPLNVREIVLDTREADL